MAEGQRGGNFHWLYSLYAAETILPGVTHSISERKLLRAGGVQNDPTQFLNHSKTALLDYSETYDYGAELNAISCQYMFASHRRYDDYPLYDQSLLSSTRSWYDSHLQHYEQNFTSNNAGGSPFVRGLAFAVMSLDCMYRASGDQEYLRHEIRLVDLILATQHVTDAGTAHGVFRCLDGDGYIDCQAAAILALCRAAYFIKDERLSSAIGLAIKAIQIDEWKIGGDDGVIERTLPKITLLLRPGSNKKDGIRWGFKAGLLLRALAAADVARKQAIINLSDDVSSHIARLDSLARGYINALNVEHDDGRQLLTGYGAGETNSKSQPWMLLGLFPIDEEIIKIMPPGR